MAGYTVYRKADRKPIPEGADLLTRKGQRLARWTDKRGRVRTAALSEDEGSVLIERSSYYVDHDGPDGRRVTVMGYTDKEATEALAARLQKDAERVRMGLAPKVEPARSHIPWTEAMSGWLSSLTHDNLDDVYIANNRRLLTKLAEGCGWTTLAAIRRERVESWLQDIKKNGVPDLNGKRKPTLPSDRTIDQYADTAKRFLTWCVSQGYLDENPLGALKKIRRPRRVRHRRALSVDELCRLLAVAGLRAPLYQLAALTGLRKDELKQLRWGDAKLDHARPSILLRSEANKSRREDRIPLHPSASALLLRLRPDPCDPLTPVFPGVPRPLTFRRDLRKADVPRVSAEGKVADFHSLRYSFCTMLARANVPIRTAMELMRHKDPRLTLLLYTDASHLDLDEAVSRLPNLVPVSP